MPQATTRRITADDHPLATPTPVLLPGLEIDILTGSGWLLLIASVSIEGTVNGPFIGSLRYKIDGVECQDHAEGWALLQTAEFARATTNLVLLTRPGAGQHNIQVLAASDGAGGKVSGHAAQLILLEIGY
jgi:hypothetical protein